MAEVLFLSYDGFMEPLGQSQIFQYVEKLSAGHRITLVSFEKASDLDDSEHLEAHRAKARAAGICWVPLRYHKNPPVLSTAFDLARGLIVCASIVRRSGIEVVHARSYPPAVVALGLKKFLGVRFVFDMRGFWADQRADCGAWSRGPVYRVAKWFERRFLEQADVVISETRAAIGIMRRFPYLRDREPRWAVVSTCTNLEIFDPARRARAAAGRPFTLGFVGSLGVWYEFDRMLETFKLLRGLRPDARLLIVNQSSHGYIHERLAAAGVPPESVELKAARFDQVADEYARMDAGIYYLKNCYSMAAVCPTKLGEFLGSGVPCVTNDGIGDAGAILREFGAGVVVSDFGPEGQREALKALLALAGDPDTPRRCREAAKANFDLAGGVRTIDGIYRSLGGSPRPAEAGAQ